MTHRCACRSSDSVVRQPDELRTQDAALLISRFPLTEPVILVSYADWTPCLIGFPATVESTTLIGPEKVANGTSLQNVATGCQEGRGGQQALVRVVFRIHSLGGLCG
jgi:hypothetical protein